MTQIISNNGGGGSGGKLCDFVADVPYECWEGESKAISGDKVYAKVSDMENTLNTALQPGDNVSDLCNDAGYIDSSALSGYALACDIPTDNCQLANGCCYITSGDLPDQSCYQLKCNLVTSLSGADNDHYPSAKAVADALSCAGAGDMMKSVYDPNSIEANAFDYCNFINTPDLSGFALACDIPTDNCQLANSCGFTTCTGTVVASDLNNYAKCCDIPTDNCQLSNSCGYTTCTGTVVASDLTPLATDSCVVHLAGAETVTGTKTFCSPVTIMSDCNSAFDVQSTSSGGYLYVTRNPGVSQVQMAIKAGLNGGTFGTTSDNQFQFRTNDVMRMQVDSGTSGGKVQLATTSVPTAGDCSNYVPSTKWVQNELGSYAKSCTLCTVSTSGKYCDLTGKPDKVSCFTNDSGFTTCTGTLSSCADIISALGYTPYSSSNPSGYTTCTGTLTSSDLATYAHCTDIPTDNCQLSNSCGYTTCTGTISNCAGVISALGYTPYNSSNPNGYTTCTGTLTAETVVSGDSGCTYTIKKSTTAPSGAGSNTITLVTE